MLKLSGLDLKDSQYIYACSFYRILINILESFSNLNDSLIKLFSCNTQFPMVIVAGDLNLVDIMWMDGHGSVKSNPTSGIKITPSSWIYQMNSLDGLEQLLDEPTKNDHLLDLVLSTYPDIIICDITVVSGMSDYEAVTSSIKHITMLHVTFSHLRLRSKPQTVVHN